MSSEQNEILSVVAPIFSDLFGVDADEIGIDTTRDSVDADRVPPLSPARDEIERGGYDEENGGDEVDSKRPPEGKPYEEEQRQEQVSCDVGPREVRDPVRPKADSEKPRRGQTEA